jgi:hypothetical protein
MVVLNSFVDCPGVQAAIKAGVEWAPTPAAGRHCGTAEVADDFGLLRTCPS